MYQTNGNVSWDLKYKIKMRSNNITKDRLGKRTESVVRSLHYAGKDTNADTY